MSLTKKIEGIVTDNALQKAYGDMWERCPPNKRELLNLIMIEANCGLPFVEKLLQHIPEVIDNKPNEKCKVKNAK